MNRLSRIGKYASIPLTLCLLLLVPAIMADGGAAHRVSSDSYGVSGGNVNDRSNAFCCSGTLGSLVKDASNNLYILSNNHVMGRSGAATAGEDISQPGLIDASPTCSVEELVADFTLAPSLTTSNVDAAIARLRTGAMRSDGAILDIGTISSTVATPAIGLGVQKSGRTTGRTTASIGAINLAVSVQYQQGCGKGKKFTATFRNQISINSASFSAGGDSGSLIVSTGTCPQPVGLLYAGSSTSTIANPAAEVLTRLTASLGSAVSFVGGTCAASASSVRTSNDGAILPNIPQDVIDRATRVMEARVDDLMSRPGIIGVGIGESQTDAMGAAIVIFVDSTSKATPKVPKSIKGVPVRVEFTEPFVAY
jgi:hypothetical protein